MMSAWTDSSGGINGGKLYNWGRNYYGNMGDGTTVDIGHLIGPTQIGSATDWRYNNQSYHNFHAIKTNGTMWACGLNTQGQIGDGTTVSKSSPVQVGTDTDWETVAGCYRIAALKTDGTLWAWGGQGGYAHGNGTNLSVPTQVGAETYWESLCSFNGGFLARRTDGKMYAFGALNPGSGYWASGHLSYVTSPMMCGSVGGTTWDQAPTTHMSLEGQNGRGTGKVGWYTY
jgi:alpha-tubulin suppressor-like RCC1 family protein